MKANFSSPLLNVKCTEYLYFIELKNVLLYDMKFDIF